MNEQIKKWLKNHLVNSEYTEFGWQECHRYEFDEDEIEEFTKLIVKDVFAMLKEAMLEGDDSKTDEIIDDRLQDAAGDVVDAYGIVDRVY